MTAEKMKEVFADKEFVKSLLKMEDTAEMQAALKEKGVELTEQDILCLRDFITKVENGEISSEKFEKWAKQAENGELPEEMLEYVSGGSLILGILLIYAGTCMIAGSIVSTVADANSKK